MRAVDFRRRCFSLDVARRYCFAKSLEHYAIFIYRASSAPEVGPTIPQEAAFCRWDYTIVGSRQ